MRIQVIAVGKLKEAYLVQAVDEYSKRIRRYSRLAIDTVPEEPYSESDGEGRRAELKAAEGKRILGRIRPGSHVIACDLAGVEMTSEGFARLLAGLALSGDSDITFLIGGPLGYAPEVLDRAERRICFSKMTFPHQLMRVILLEQVYRAFKINRNEPYHY